MNLNGHHKSILCEQFEDWKMELIDKLGIFRLINTNGRNSHITKFEGPSHCLSMLCAKSLFELEIFVFNLKLLCVFRILKRILPYTKNKRHNKRVKVRYLREYTNTHYSYLIDIVKCFSKYKVHIYFCQVDLAQEQIPKNGH